MRVLLANAPWTEGGIRAGSRWSHIKKGLRKKQRERKYTSVPFFLGYATSLLLKDGHEAKFIDSLAIEQTPSEFFDLVKSFRPDVLVVENSTVSLFNDLAIMQRVKREVECFTIMTGPHTTGRPQDAFINGEKAVDLVIMGEYEFPLREVMERLERSQSFRDTPNVAYMDNDALKVNPCRALEPLDNFPWLPYDQMPMDRYYTGFSLAYPEAQLLSSRGCPYRCNFCLWVQVLYNRAVRLRNPVNVVDEIEFLKDKYKIRGVFFNDDTFTLSKKHVMAISNGILKRGLDVKWSCFGHVNTVDREMLETMRKSGCVRIKYGVESGSQEILNNIGKGTTLSQIRKAIEMTKQANIFVHTSFAIGLPGETWETIEQTLNLAVELAPSSLIFSVATPFPGTDFFDYAEKKGFLTTHDWSRYDGQSKSVVRTEKMSAEEIERAVQYLWQKYELKRMERRLGESGAIWETISNKGLRYLISRSLSYIRNYLKFRSEYR